MYLFNMTWFLFQATEAILLIFSNANQNFCALLARTYAVVVLINFTNDLDLKSCYI